MDHGFWTHANANRLHYYDLFEELSGVAALTMCA